MGTEQEVKRIAESLQEEFDLMVDGLDGEPIVQDDYEYEDLGDWLNQTALEIYAKGRYGWDGWDVRSVVVVFGTGGPHREIEFNWDGRVTGQAYWGVDSATDHLGYDQMVANYVVELLGLGF